MTIPALAHESDILARLHAEVTESLELVGERSAFLLTYLAAQSRRLDPEIGGSKPVGITAHGSSSSGKSFTQDLALSFIAEADIWRVTTLSDKALTRKSTEDFKGKVVVIGEGTALGGQNSTIAYLFRKLFDDGRIVHEVLEERLNPLDAEEMGKYEARSYEVGPGAWFSLMTSTTGEIHAENATRQIGLFVDESDAQTRAVVRAAMRRAVEDVSPVDRVPWRELDSWLSSSAAARDVAIPGWLIDVADGMRIPPSSVQFRRISGLLISLVRSHALLHQASRERDDRGRVVATLDDYSSVRSLLDPELSRLSGASVPGNLRKLLDAIPLLMITVDYGDRMGPSAAELAAYLKVSQPTTSRWLKDAVERGLIQALVFQGVRRYSAVGASRDDSWVLPPVMCSPDGVRYVLVEEVSE